MNGGIYYQSFLHSSFIIYNSSFSKHNSNRMIPPKIQKWIDKDVFPQRTLFSATHGALDIALHVAAKLQDISLKKVQSGIHSDTIVFRDTGKSFKIDWSDAAKKDDQGEHENVRGLIKWAHQSPAEGKYRVVILENLERLSRESPHACLKLIEEPPRRTIFLFTTQNHHNERLLDTILSRVTVVRLPSTDPPTPDPLAQQFLNTSSLLERFKVIEDLDKTSKDNQDKKMDRTVFYTFLQSLLYEIQKNPLHHQHLELVSDTYQSIQRNINPRLTFERMVVKMREEATAKPIDHPRSTHTF